MKPKKKICIECGKKFMPYRTTQRVCSPQCAIKHQKTKKQSKIKQMKRDLMTPNKYRSKYFQPVVNEIVRIIDNGQPCICRPNELGTDAGHFISTGSNNTLSLNFHNIHIQSRNSNGFRGGESLKYYKGLIRVYGKDYAEYCDQLQRCKPLKLTVDELEEARSRLMPFRLKLRKEINKPLEAKERINLRNEANQITRIYPKQFEIFKK